MLSKDDYIGLAAILFMLIGASMISYYLITEKMHNCTSEPVKYAADKLAKENNISYTYAELSIYFNENDLVPVKTEKLDLSTISINNKIKK